MKIKTTWILLFVFLSTLGNLLPFSWGAVGNSFPTLTEQTLSGRSVTLPLHISEHYSLILLAFERETQTQADSWGQFANGRLATERPSIQYFYVPALSGFYSFISGVIKGGMRKKFSPGLQDQTILYVGDLDPIKEALQVKATELAHVVLVDAQSKIIAQWSGAIKEEYIAEILQKTTPNSPTPPKIEKKPKI